MKNLSSKEQCFELYEKLKDEVLNITNEIELKKNEISQKDTEIAQKDTEIAQKDIELAKKDEYIQFLKKQLEKAGILQSE